MTKLRSIKALFASFGIATSLILFAPMLALHLTTSKSPIWHIMPTRTDYVALANDKHPEEDLTKAKPLQIGQIARGVMPYKDMTTSGYVYYKIEVSEPCMLRISFNHDRDYESAGGYFFHWLDASGDYYLDHAFFPDYNNWTQWRSLASQEWTRVTPTIYANPGTYYVVGYSSMYCSAPYRIWVDSGNCSKLGHACVHGASTNETEHWLNCDLCGTKFYAENHQSEADYQMLDEQYHAKQCDRCKTYFDKQEHDYADWEIDYPPYGTSEGMMSRECQTCDYIDHKVIPAIKPTLEQRIAGEESADTAAQIALEAFPGGSEWVVIARDDDFADAMSATGLAGALDAPIVLTDRNELSGATADAVKKLGAKKAYIVGGTGAIPGDLEGALEKIGCKVKERVFGQEAYDTSAECAKLIQETVGSGTPYAVVAYGQNFQDALSMSSFAYRHKCPIFLQTYGDTSAERALTDDAKAMLTGDGAWAGAQVFVAGGNGAVSEASAERLLGKGRVVRLAGEDGFDTSNQIATYMVENGLLSASTVCVANGAEKPKGTDALAGAALAGRKGGVMLLANANGACGEVSRVTIEGTDSKGDPAFLTEHAGEVSDAYVLGGSYVMPEDFRAEINGILR